jgi:5-formyltetrahydrofolate cyclo-ligase
MAERELDQAEQRLRMQAKAELRTRIRGLRRVMPEAACAARSQAICERLVALPAFERARAVIGYAAFRKEADPGAALRVAASAGKRVGLPRVADDGSLSLHAYAEGDALEPSGYGILEPLASARAIADAEVELIIVPALVVDARGHRIGYGEGFYDRLLPRLPGAFKVVIAYDFQLLAETPDTHRDVPVDCVVTDTRVLMV